MIIIADSSSTRTEWVISDNGIVVEKALTTGLNPYFLTRREISHIIRLELPGAFFRRRWEHVYFYGAGCHSKDKISVMEHSVVAQFKTPTTIHSNLLGAARGMLVNKPGLVGIISTGSTSCLYDGRDIVKHVPGGGYVLGDEGSNSWLGRKLVADVIKGMAPMHLIDKFFDYFHTDVDEVMDLVYSHPQAKRTLAGYSAFIKDNIDDPYCSQMVYDGFRCYFKRNLHAYDYKDIPMSFVGSTVCLYENILRDVAKEVGVRISDIRPSSMPGLVEYHSVVNS